MAKFHSIFLLILIIGLLMACKTENTPTKNSYYVAPQGDDAYPGTEAQPWRSIQQAVDNVSPGSTIFVMDGVYTESVLFKHSGSEEEGYITLQNYPGHKPVISGADSKEAYLIYINNKHHLKIIGFEIGPLRVTRGFPSAIWVLGAAHHIEIRDIYVHHIENDGDAHGIAVYGTSQEPAHDIHIEGNEIAYCKLGSSESLVINGNVENFVIANNIVHDNNNIGIDIIGHEGKCADPEQDQARDGTVVGNLVYNIDARGNPAYGDERSADGIYVDGGTRILIERNEIHNCNIGIEVASEWARKDTSYITVRNNIIYNSHTTGIAIGGYDSKRGSAHHNYILNNTLYNNDTDQGGNGELLIQFQVQDTSIQNNIFYANAQGLLISNPYKIKNVSVDYNLYFTPLDEQESEWQWEDQSYQGFEAYRTATGNDAHSRFADPRFMDQSVPDFHLREDSPAIGAGIILSEVGDTDIDGNPRVENGTINQGATASPH